MSDKDNGAPGTLGNIGKAAEHGAHFVCPVHVGLFAHVRLYGVKDNQPRPVLRDCLFYALVGQGKLPLGFINHKHAVKVGFGFYQAGLDGIAQPVLGGLEMCIRDRSDSRYATLDAQYEKEQSELTAEISALEKAVKSYEKHEKDADRFIALIDKFENFDKLTIAMLNEFIEKILVHERDRKGSIQTVSYTHLKEE